MLESEIQEIVNDLELQHTIWQKNVGFTLLTEFDYYVSALDGNYHGDDAICILHAMGYSRKLLLKTYGYGV